MTKSVQVQVGDQLFEHEDGQAFGAVLAVRPHELLVNIEGAGQVLLPAAAVAAVHDGKVVVDSSALTPELQQQIRHAHDRETEY
jgi:hypothetical protein